MSDDVSSQRSHSRVCSGKRSLEILCRKLLDQYYFKIKNIYNSTISVKVKKIKKCIFLSPIAFAIISCWNSTEFLLLNKQS